MPQPTVMLSEAARQRRQRAVGRALSGARGDMSQTELSAKTGIPQTTISRYERGTVDLTMEQALEIETTLGLKPGSLAEAGGYIQTKREGNDASASAIETLLRRCPDIDPDLRQICITALRSQVTVTRRLNREESIRSLPDDANHRRRRARV